MARPKAGVTFWDRVYQHVEQDGECMIFKGHVNEDGYGRIHKDGRLVFIHREVWKLYNGDIPAGMEVCHTCDRPPCLNPDHFWIGTHLANMQDRSRKGRQARLFGNTHTKGKSINRGSSHGSAKFTEEQVARIKVSLRADGSDRNIRALAAEYGVSRTAIYHIKGGTRWKHVP